MPTITENPSVILSQMYPASPPPNPVDIVNELQFANPNASYNKRKKVTSLLINLLFLLNKLLFMLFVVFFFQCLLINMTICFLKNSIEPNNNSVVILYFFILLILVLEKLKSIFLNYFTWIFSKIYQSILTQLEQNLYISCFNVFLFQFDVFLFNFSFVFNICVLNGMFELIIKIEIHFS